MVIIIGSGRLSKALLSQIKHDQVGVYGRNQKTVRELTSQYPFAVPVKKEELKKAEMMLVCLPKNAYEEFFQEHIHDLNEDVLIVHFATALLAKDVIPLVEGRTLLPCKLVGHAAQLIEDKNGLLAIPPAYAHFKDEITRLFPALRVELVSEEDVLAANKLATKETLKMLIQIEAKAKEMKLSNQVTKQIQKQIAPGVVRGYLNNDLGGFAKSIIDELKSNS
ncbi:NAD(P)-binding domain-containing protein [Alkalihalophilus marmarensis]|uniref:NAD(P)-binding domain-containing protein n=1 Tax=Alkalihalophilus marmarensis TaxID=521377 RepID=UPI002E23DAE3|nr:NAD(P)-binding domain-containing protein [Alkalihalophilus marmarensis]